MKKVLLVLLPVFWPKMPPIGLGYLQGFLISNGVNCDILDINNIFYNLSSGELKKSWLISCNRPFFGISVIVGYPGETRDEFTKSLDFIIRNGAPRAVPVVPLTYSASPKCFHIWASQELSAFGQISSKRHPAEADAFSLSSTGKARGLQAKADKALIPKIEQVNPFMYYDGATSGRKPDKNALERLDIFIKEVKSNGFKYTNAFLGNLIEKPFI